MATTIAIKADTLQMLNLMKQSTNAKNYDDVIKGIILKAKTPQISYFGKFKKLGEFKREKVDRIDRYLRMD